MAKLMIIDDQIIFKETVEILLSQNFQDLQMVSFDSSDIPSIIRNAWAPDYALIDFGMKNGDVLNLIQHFQAHDVKVILMVSSLQEKELLLNALKYRVSGLFLKSMAPDLFLKAINNIFNGQKFIDSKIALFLWDEYIQGYNSKLINKPSNSLTEREWEILDFLVQGLSNRMIASKIFLSENTVKNHVTSLLKKLNVKDRTSAVIEAYKNEWTLKSGE